MNKQDQRFFEIIQAHGVRVEYTDLGKRGRYGEYWLGRRLVNLQLGMAPRLHSFVLAHETFHVINGDTPSMFEWFDAKMERRADEWAATQLIDPDHYREVEHQREGHVPSMAHDLGVISDTVETFQRMLTRIGDTVYLNAKHGVGQWDQRIAAVA